MNIIIKSFLYKFEDAAGMAVWKKNDAGRNAPEKSTGIEQGKDKL